MILTDWHAMQTRAEKALEKAKAKRDEADFAVQRAEMDLEAIKVKRRRADADADARAGLGVR